MQQFTSHLDFKLASKRFGMMSRKSSSFKRSSRLAVLLPVIGGLFLSYCVKSSGIEKLGEWGYHDIKLERKYENGIPVHYDPNKEPFTGARKTYAYEVDHPIAVTLFENGVAVSYKSYFRDGQINLDMHTMSIDPNARYRRSKDSYISYDQEGNKLFETLEPIHAANGLGFKKEWYPNGVLKSEINWDTLYHYQGLITLQDSTGALIAQERYLDGELIEKIK